jgi:Phosphosulfolactate phosphohydrolase and related enzymes
MKVNVIFSPVNIAEMYFTGKTTVVIDVLRATSTIVTALNNGAREIIPVDSTQFALKSPSSTFGGQILTGGERNTKKIDGFNFGNSPLEYTEEAVKGKSIILFTTNGTKAIVKAKFSESLFLCSFLNLSTVAGKLVKIGKDVEIVCSGGSGFFCTEDSVCAGKVIEEIINTGVDVVLNDSAAASLHLAKGLGKNIFKTLSLCDHGKLLIENGYKEDVKFCSNLNSFNVLPKFHDNTVKLLPLKNEASS